MTTEWEDIQIKLGNLPSKEVQKPLTEKEYDSIAQENKNFMENVIKESILSNSTLEELEEFEDLEDEKILEEYRKKRIAELKAEAEKNKYGRVYHINEQEYKEEVTETSKKGEWVIVLLNKPGLPGCDIMEELLNIIAKKFKYLKIVTIRSDDAIRNYPDKNLPTLLIYKDGDVKKQFIGLEPFGGQDITANDLEWNFSQLGIINSELEENPRNKKKFTTIKKQGYLNTYRGYEED